MTMCVMFHIPAIDQSRLNNFIDELIPLPSPHSWNWRSLFKPYQNYTK